jgi:hypothetical protein
MEQACYISRRMWLVGIMHPTWVCPGSIPSPAVPIRPCIVAVLGPADRSLAMALPTPLFRPTCTVLITGPCRLRENGGQLSQALGHSRGGFSTKVHVRVDGLAINEYGASERSRWVHIDTPAAT